MQKKCQKFRTQTYTSVQNSATGAASLEAERPNLKTKQICYKQILTLVIIGDRDAPIRQWPIIGRPIIGI